MQPHRRASEGFSRQTPRAGGIRSSIGTRPRPRECTPHALDLITKRSRRPFRDARPGTRERMTPVRAPAWGSRVQIPPLRPKLSNIENTLSSCSLSPDQRENGTERHQSAHIGAESPGGVPEFCSLLVPRHTGLPNRTSAPTAGVSSTSEWRTYGWE